MTAAALLADLQALWKHPPPISKEPDKPPRCPSHIDPRDWLDRPAPSRPGWIRTTCRRCGVFIGYRLADLPKKRHRSPKVG